MDARQILKILIKEYGGTQKVFASIIGTTQPAVANWIAAGGDASQGLSGHELYSLLLAVAHGEALLQPDADQCGSAYPG